MRFVDRDEVVRRETIWLRSTADWVRDAVDEFPNLDVSERSALRRAVLLAWVRWRVPIVQQQAVMVAGTTLAACSMLVAAGLAGAVAGAGRGGMWNYEVVLFASVCLGVTASRRRIVWSNLRGLMSRSVHRPAHWLSVVGLFPAIVSLLLLTALGSASGFSAWILTRMDAEQRLVAYAGVLFGFALGLGTRRWMHLWESIINHRYKHADRERPLDGALYMLFVVTARCYALRSVWWDAQAIRGTRQRLDYLAVDLQRASVVHRRTSLKDWSVRRQGRRDHAVLAELVERHSSALACVRTADEYRTLCDSLRSGVTALAAGDLVQLFAHQAAEPVLSRADRLLRRFAPALALVSFALVIPLLPGVAGPTGEGVRWLLLMTAILSLVPANEVMSGTVRSALDKSLFTTAKP